MMIKTTVALLLTIMPFAAARAEPPVSQTAIPNFITPMPGGQSPTPGIETIPVKPFCDDGWILVQFPGTQIPICAHEVKPAYTQQRLVPPK